MCATCRIARRRCPEMTTAAWSGGYARHSAARCSNEGRQTTGPSRVGTVQEPRKGRPDGRFSVGPRRGVVADLGATPFVPGHETVTVFATQQRPIVVAHQERTIGPVAHRKSPSNQPLLDHREAMDSATAPSKSLAAPAASGRRGRGRSGADPRRQLYHAPWRWHPPGEPRRARIEAPRAECSRRVHGPATAFRSAGGEGAAEFPDARERISRCRCRCSSDPEALLINRLIRASRREVAVADGVVTEKATASGPSSAAIPPQRRYPVSSAPRPNRCAASPGSGSPFGQMRHWPETTGGRARQPGPGAARPLRLVPCRSDGTGRVRAPRATILHHRLASAAERRADVQVRRVSSGAQSTSHPGGMLRHGSVDASRTTSRRMP